MVDVFLQMICLRVIRLQVLLMVLGDNKDVTLSRATCDKLHVTPDIFGDDVGMTCVITSAVNTINIIWFKVKVTLYIAVYPVFFSLFTSKHSF